jgi:hypothetical protein
MELTMNKSLDDWYAATQKMIEEAYSSPDVGPEKMKEIVDEWIERLKMIEKAAPGIAERYERRRRIQNSLTAEHIDFICYQIGEWYIEWQNKMWVDGKPNQHWLGVAKEQLKTMICG